MIGKKISLRALEPNDAKTLYAWENDPEVWRISNTVAPYSRFDIDQYILNAGDIYSSKQLRLIIVLTEDPDVTVGAIDLFDYDPLHRRAELGILVDNTFRGKGYAQEAIELIKDYAFNTINLHQLYCYVPADKKINLHLFTKCGFIFSGTRREWRWSKDQWTDEHLLQLIP
ncbi:MAG: GNAT family N-acetyltransferase [Omnitrophica WOR_2 bacterium]|jgi:diamine N-acetyltransferase